MWDRSHMPNELSNEEFLRLRIAQAIEEAPHARDHYDKLIQQRTGTKGKVIYDIQRGKSKKPSMATIQAIADAFSLPASFFVQGTPGEPLDIARSPDVLPTRSAHADDGVVEITALDLSLSMGPGTLIEDFIEAEPIKLDMGLVRAITRSPFNMLRMVRGIGDSMEPTLRTSDRVLIDTSEKMLSRMHGIYWVDHMGAHGLKRLRAVGQGRVLIMSDNPAVPDYDVDAEEMRIHGRAIWLLRDL